MLDKNVKYQIWYIPRIQDELALANFSNLDDAIEQMDQLEQKKTKSIPTSLYMGCEQKTESRKWKIEIRVGNTL